VKHCLPVAVTATAYNGPCETSGQGVITAIAKEGTAPYSYNLQPGNVTNTTGIFTGLAIGNYTVTVTDADLGTATTTVAIGAAAPCITEVCFASPTKPNIAYARSTITYTANTVKIRTTLSKKFTDNTYGTNAIGWPVAHTFNNMKDKDRLQIQLYDGMGTKKMEFKMDYLSASGAAPSGYKSLGVTGGQGGMILGSAANVVGVVTSLDRNFNVAGHVLTTNSPAASNTYVPVIPIYNNWIFEVWYEVEVNKSAFGLYGFGTIGIAKIRSEPSKTGKNDEAVNTVNCSGQPAPFNGPTTPVITTTPVNPNSNIVKPKMAPAEPVFEDPMLALHPNPATSNVTVSFRPQTTGNSAIILYDFNGKEVMSLYRGLSEKGKLYTYTVDISHLAQGIYIARFRNNKESLTRKLVIAR
jgi:hypothetical protein